MTNHVHLIAIPRHPDSLAKALGQTHWRYAMRFNRLHRCSGHLWQNRFYSCPLGPSHLATALAYVDLNPVRARLVAQATDYPWSSASAHTTGQDEWGLIDNWDWNDGVPTDDWAQQLHALASTAEDRELRRATYSGMPFGDQAFVDQLELTLARRLQPGTPGRKPKALAVGV